MSITHLIRPSPFGFCEIHPLQRPRGKGNLRFKGLLEGIVDLTLTG